MNTNYLPILLDTAPTLTGVNRIGAVRTCCVCHESYVISMPMHQWDAWTGTEAYVQDIFPHLTADEREMILSGTHPACWSKLFPSED